MKNISQEELNEILEKHEMWLKRKKGGECANLNNVDLRDVDLLGINLRCADLSYANLTSADLSYANLSEADLSYVSLNDANLWNTNLSYTDLSNTDLSNADLSESDLNNADLSYANLIGVNLSYTNLSYANLKGADLRNAKLNNSNLYNANLRYANLNNIETNMNTIGYNLVCPEEGSFIGYKIARGCIVKLLILEDSKRSSATSSKCRCDKAKVLEIREIETGKKVDEVSSNYDLCFTYKVGEIVSVEDFDDNRWNECAPGIHFFINKENALNYYY